MKQIRKVDCKHRMPWTICTKRNIYLGHAQCLTNEEFAVLPILLYETLSLSAQKFANDLRERSGVLKSFAEVHNLLLNKEILLPASIYIFLIDGSSCPSLAKELHEIKQFLASPLLHPVLNGQSVTCISVRHCLIKVWATEALSLSPELDKVISVFQSAPEWLFLQPQGLEFPS